MNTFTTIHELDGLDLHIPLALPFFFESCVVEISYSIDIEGDIDWDVEVIVIRTETHSFVPSGKQTYNVLKHIKQKWILDKIRDNEVCLKAKYEQEKAEWLYERDMYWRD